MDGVALREIPLVLFADESFCCRVFVRRLDEHVCTGSFFVVARAVLMREPSEISPNVREISRRIVPDARARVLLRKVNDASVTCVRDCRSSLSLLLRPFLYFCGF